MARKVSLLVVFFILVLSVFSNVFAEEKKDGLIKRMWNKLTFKDNKEAVKPQEPVKAAPIKMAPEKITPVSQAPVKQTPAQATSRSQAPAQKSPVAKSGEIKLTKEVMLDSIYKNLNMFGDEILPKISSLVKVVGKNGSIQYKFKKAGGPEIDLNKVDEATLFNIYGKVNSEVNVVQTERSLGQLRTINQQDAILRQMRQAETVQRAQKVQDGLNAVRSIPKPVPKVPSVPKSVPKIPQSVPKNPPRVPNI